jgi:hypothetical protein
MKVELGFYALPPSEYDEEAMERGYKLEVDSTPDVCPDNWILLGREFVDLPIPEDVDIVPQMVERLREKQSSIRATAEKECSKIADQIAGMLCITHEKE